MTQTRNAAPILPMYQRLLELGRTQMNLQQQEHEQEQTDRRGRTGTVG